MRFEVLTAVKMAMLFWVVTPCGLVDRHQIFGETYCLHLQGWFPGIYLRVHKASQPRRTTSSLQKMLSAIQKLHVITRLRLPFWWNNSCMRSEVLTAVKIPMLVFWFRRSTLCPSSGLKFSETFVSFYRFTRRYYSKTKIGVFTAVRTSNFCCCTPHSRAAITLAPSVDCYPVALILTNFIFSCEIFNEIRNILTLAVS
jgi:hypothetical protein